MRRLLFITFDFPPQRTSGVYRHVGLCRYLTRFGWEPTVLTVAGGVADVEDASLLAKLPPQVRVERTSWLRLDAWEATATKVVKQAGALQTAAATPRERWRDRFLRRAGEWVRALLYFPDITAGWIPLGVIRAATLHMGRHFEVVYTSSPPKSAAVIGLLLKLLFRVPWVCEFRDPWYPPKLRLRQRMERWLQTRVVRRADRIVVISDGNAEELCRIFGLAPDKVVVVPNGYDEEDFEVVARNGGPFEPGLVHLSHFGTVYSHFSGQFFPALAELVREKPELRGRLRVNIVGFSYDPQVREYALGELKDVIRCYPFMPHLEALEAMYSSDGLLLFLANETTSRLSGLGKIYWYLRVGKPVLAVAPEGGTKTLVEEAQAGWAVMDRASIKQALIELLGRNGKSGSGQPVRPEYVARFRYDRLAGELAGVLEGVAG